MNLDQQTLIEIEDYINHLDEKIGLRPETMLDIDKAISKYRNGLKNSNSAPNPTSTKAQEPKAGL